MNTIKTKLKSIRFINDKIMPKYRAVRNYGQWLRKSLMPLYWRIPMGINGGVFSIELEAAVGLFATLTQVLWLLFYCDKHKYVPRIRLTGLNYINTEIGPDWFDYFFENQSLSSIEKIPRNPRYTHHINNLNDLGIGGYFLPTLTDMGTTLYEAHDIFYRYIQIKPDIQDTVNKFCKKYFRNMCVLGVHYRGTDKNSEAPRVSWDSCCQAISDYLVAHPEVNAIFVASDECGFVNRIKANFSHIDVIAHKDEYRSNGSQAIHSLSFKGDNYKKGKDALINSLLLSKCSALIRTTSALSGWASIFNPEIPVILLNKPYNHTCWFPETAILKTAQTHGLFDGEGVTFKV